MRHSTIIMYQKSVTVNSGLNTIRCKVYSLILGDKNMLLEKQQSK